LFFLNLKFFILPMSVCSPSLPWVANVKSSMEIELYCRKLIYLNLLWSCFGHYLELFLHKEQIVEVFFGERGIEFCFEFYDGIGLCFVEDHLVDVSKVTEYVVNHSNIQGKMFKTCHMNHLRKFLIYLIKHFNRNEPKILPTRLGCC
jgi:hypothetical protein